MEETKTTSDESTKLVSDIISDEEIELFYKLLPKVQEAQHFLESLNNHPDNLEDDNINDMPSPYIVELDINCSVFEKGNSAVDAPDKVYHEGKKFYIDFIVSDYKAFIETFYNNIQESLTKSCKDLYPSNNVKSEEQKAD